MIAGRIPPHEGYSNNLNVSR